MSVEEISWDDADLILDEMKAENKVHRCLRLDNISQFLLGLPHASGLFIDLYFAKK